VPQIGLRERRINKTFREEPDAWHEPSQTPL
jgi:hypothetical protein